MFRPARGVLSALLVARSRLFRNEAPMRGTGVRPGPCHGSNFSRGPCSDEASSKRSLGSVS